MMLSKITLLLMALTLNVALHAQSAAEILKDKEAPLFYYGIDFTKAKLIGDPNANLNDIVERQFAGINALMLNEAKKYDIAGAFRREELKSDLSFVDKRNTGIDPDNIASSNTEDFYHLTEKDIATLVKGFNGGDRTGTGLLFVVEGMSKYKKALSVWVTLFDIKSKKILLTDRVEGEVGVAFSFRNYWAAGFKNVIDKISNRKYKEWVSK